MTTTSMDVKATEARHLLQNYRRQPIVFERGEGVRLFDDRGRAYLDFVSGLGVAALGHAHPALARALADQASTLMHTSNLYFNPLQGELAERLTTLTGLDRAFYCNSGTEAMEGAMKFARRYWHVQGKSRRKFVAFSQSFHGRTMGALSVTWEKNYREPFMPLVPDVAFVEHDDPAALDALVDTDTAAIVVEPIRGEGGVRPVSGAIAQAIEAACKRTGALLIADEVQSGSGRTGAFLRSPASGLTPDLVTLAKALGAGFPVGAIMLSKEVAATIAAGDHGTTYGGNLMACRAALTFLDELDGLREPMRRVSAYLFERLHELKAQSEGAIVEIRGAGHFVGIDLAFDAAPVVPAALERGLLVNRTATTVVRMLPPYVITEQHVDEAMPVLRDAIAHAKGSSR